MKRLHKSPAPFLALELADSVGREQGLRLDDPAAFDRIADNLADAARQARDNPITLHGRRVEAMFGYVAASLGACKIVKREDAGDTFVPPDAELAVPDYRLLLKSNRQLLVEVKNCHSKNPDKVLKLDHDYVSALEAYGSLFDCDVHIAIYWSRWTLWTMIPTAALKNHGSKRTISFLDSLKYNEMVSLDDVVLATTPPLTFRVVTDATKPRRIRDDGQVVFTIGGVEFYAGRTRISRDAEKSLALYLMFYGTWVEEAPRVKVEDHELISIDFVANPVESEAEEGFDTIGHMSGMISRRFNDLTTAEQEIHRLAPPVEPGALGAAIPGKVPEMEMPLWVFHVRPASQ